MVFRGFLSDFLEAGNNQLNLRDEILVYTCDRDSKKVKELQNNHNAEICWYFPQTREQFRLKSVGTLVLSPENDGTYCTNKEIIRKKVWNFISDSAKEMFIRKQNSNGTGGDLKNLEEGYCNFGIILFNVSCIDHVVLPNVRSIYKNESDGGDWKLITD
ncbi:hypothetical protein HK099_000427 [Clydaea vesicula]|uniref:Pyridoxamine 5'-phosphate oxidase Alr4036 family FMN-binding domain-containing protein n=1 Tax=Clydaea vesicula TaxID=447962 RepID=A0AAD5UAS7_9FUNG|nr:hypothetical protein HK099_000427 [Clydaea vesicula]KAJ3396055.1 hypothetical protein HDU92_004180 [Lobulomyces angularis]